MYILRRRKDESFRINDVITVIITEVEDNRVQIGIKAPPEISIAREELLKKERQR